MPVDDALMADLSEKPPLGDNSVMARMWRAEQEKKRSDRKKRLLLSSDGQTAYVGFVPLFGREEMKAFIDYADNNVIMMDTTFNVSKYDFTLWAMECACTTPLPLFLLLSLSRGHDLIDNGVSHGYDVVPLTPFRLYGQLLTLYMKDDNNRPVPGPQFFLTHCRAEHVTGCLDYLHSLAPSVKPASFIMDDSATEQKGVNASLFAGTPITLCHVHLSRTLKRRVSKYDYILCL